MLIFFDCEFTDLLPDAGLISIGLAAERDVVKPLYIELSEGWTRDGCSNFVLTTVLPLLGRHHPFQISREETATRIQEWLDNLRRGDREKKLIFLSDSSRDWSYLLGLFPSKPGDVPWPSRFNIEGRNVLNELIQEKAELREFNEALEDFFQKRAQVRLRWPGFLAKRP